MPSQAIASSSASEDAPQEHDGSEAWFQRTRLAAHRPWPVRKWFSVDHKRRRRSNPGGAMEGSTISERFTTSEAAHSSVYFCRHGYTSSCCDFSSRTRRLNVVRQTSGYQGESGVGFCDSGCDRHITDGDKIEWWSLFYLLVFLLFIYNFAAHVDYVIIIAIIIIYWFFLLIWLLFDTL